MLPRHLLVARLHAEEDDVGRATRQAAFQVRLASDFFRLDIVGIQRLHRLVKQASLDLLANTNQHQEKNEKTLQPDHSVCVTSCVSPLPRMCARACAHPVVQLWGELGQEAADDSFAVISLDEDLRDQRRTESQLLEVVQLNNTKESQLQQCRFNQMCSN